MKEAAASTLRKPLAKPQSRYVFPFAPYSIIPPFQHSSKEEFAEWLAK